MGFLPRLRFSFLIRGIHVDHGRRGELGRGREEHICKQNREGWLYFKSA